MLNMLYNIIIFPLTQILEFCYQFIFEMTGNKGVAVLSLSFIVTLCTIPLYMVAESWSEKERQIQDEMAYRLARIKLAFSGDERYMMQNEYYRQKGYHPLMALRSSFGILIQVPFFIAAYQYISNLGTLKGYSFYFIKDFGAPDATLTIGSFVVNILPIAMTVINCVSGYIYSKGHKIGEKIQIYACALIFLLILYNSPAGLVLYWTMNNILSLVKNVVYKLKNPKKILYILLCLFALFCVLCAGFIFRNKKYEYRLIVFIFGVLLPLLPIVIKKFAFFIDGHFKILEEKKQLRFSVFFISAVVLTVLCGIAIPSILMESEPTNYCYVDTYNSPFVFLRTTMKQAVGFFLFWPFALYALFSVRIKKILAIFFPVFAVWAVLNCFAFGGEYGPIAPNLIFMQSHTFMPSLSDFLLNIFSLCIAFVFVVFLLAKKPVIMRSFEIVILLSLAVVSTKNIFSVGSSYKNMVAPNYSEKIEPIFHLSKTGKNVIIIMQDKCFSPFIPYVFDECKGLDEKFDGFKWYPNTVSMGLRTMQGAPGLFGGYDFTPFQMNLDEEKDLMTKHNEALLTLPILFTGNGYFSEIANLVYENYDEQPQSNMYLNNPDLVKNGIEVETHSDQSKNPYTVKYKGHKTLQHNTVIGTYSNYWYAQHGMEKEPYMSSQILRNFIWFSLFKIVPPILRRAVYHKGYWISYNKWEDGATFVDNYSVHDYLPELTDFYDEKINSEEVNGTFIMIDNEATHDPVLLQAPKYEYSKKVTDNGNSPLKMNMSFSTMCGVFMRFSEFLDYLKENGVYDNTRIIIVSDHGTADSRDHYSGATKFLKNERPFPFAKCLYTATLMVKDFDSKGKMVYKGEDLDMTFMTNADTPYLATKDLFSNACNPFTKNPLKVEDKNDHVILHSAPAESTRIRHRKKFSIRDDEWYTVRNNIFVDKNWQPLYSGANE